ncbi:hypothetical protein BDW22DRAFT_1322295 [Trametopsis cervina]|nr:hypothetical protein BDW22DRAFT_1322295 [Trametopsis cervina]
MSLPSVDESHESSAASSHSGVSSQGPVSPAISNDAQSPPIPNSQYVDPDLLAGVSISFGPPVISPQLDPYTDVIPNVIALPYGRSPPLHIKAPNWRNLMRLMALLSETRVEPNIEAQAVVKTAMQLRVVVNFVKVNATSSHWHVVLYLTIDLPIPDDHRYKYRNQSDPSLLPYSYTLAPTPTHLREAADSPLQKWYSIPATNKLPFITLPVYFPDLAQYLIGALEESRRAVADRSSGLGRLAKAVDAFYPGSGQMGPLGAGDDDQDPDNRGIRNRIGKFFGRGQSAQAARPLNDERSTLVTPFYADNYGR